jgi:hypothetical protein
MEVFKIGVEMVLAGTLMESLEILAGKLTGIKAGVADVEGGFARWGLAIGAAGAALAAGGLIEALGHAVEHGGELVKQQTLLNNLLGGNTDMVQKMTDAAAHANVMGVTHAENLKAMRELIGVTPTAEDAMNIEPEVMRGATVLKQLTGADPSETLQTLAKAVELRGGGMDPVTHQLDPERLAKEIGAAVRAIVASGGLINASTLLQFMKTAGPMARMQEDPDKFYEGTLTAMMDMGGFRAGTALTALGRQLLGGQMTGPKAEELERLGILNQGQWHKSGTGVYVDPGGMNGTDLIKNPEQGLQAWMNQILIPALKEHGYTKNADVQEELYRLFGTETGRRMAGLYVQNEGQIARDAYLYDKNKGLGSYEDDANKNLDLNIEGLHSAFNDFLQEFGAPMVPLAISALQGLSGVFEKMADFAEAHPEQMKVIGEAMAALAAAFVVLGAGAVVAAAVMLAPGAAIMVGLGAIATAITTVAALNSTSAASVLASITDGISAAITTISGLNWAGAAAVFRTITDDLVSFGREIATGANWGGLLSAIGSDIGSFVGVIEKLPWASAKSVLTTIGNDLEWLANKIGALNKLITPNLDTDPKTGAPLLPKTQDEHSWLPSWLQKGSYDTPSGYSTPSGGQQTAAISVPVSLNIDGRKVAESMSEELAMMFSMPSSAPSAGAGMGFIPGDAGMTSV